MSEPTIHSARIVPSDGRADPPRFQAEVLVRFEEGGEESRLFRYYDDEIGFSEGEFAGLTKAQAHDLFRKRDVAYLQS